MKRIDTFDYLVDKYGRIALTPKEFACECGFSETHIRRLCEDGSIRAVNVGGRWRIPVHVCVAVLDRGTING